MKLLLCLALTLATAAAQSAADHSAVDPRFAFINWEGQNDQVRFEFNRTSILVGTAVLVGVVLLLVLIPVVLLFLGGDGEELTGYAPTGHQDTSYDTGYSSYARSLDDAMPIIDSLQKAWAKFQ